MLPIRLAASVPHPLLRAPAIMPDGATWAEHRAGTRGIVRLRPDHRTVGGVAPPGPVSRMTTSRE